MTILQSGPITGSRNTMYQPLALPLPTNKIKMNKMDTM